VGRYKVKGPKNRGLFDLHEAKNSVLKGEPIVSTATINAGRTERNRNRRIPPEMVAVYVLILLVLFALALMLVWGASVMSP